MRDVLAIVALAGLGWIGWGVAHRRGLVSTAPPGSGLIAGVVDAIEGILPGEGAAAATAGDPSAVAAAAPVVSQAIAYARGAIVPARDVPLVAAIILVESRANPMAHNTSGEDSRGLMQVQIATARGLLEQGQLAGLRTSNETLGQDLFDPVIGVQVGYAFIRYLRGIRGSRDWIIRAYNGGEKWETRGEAVAAATEAYLDLVVAAIDVVETAIRDQK